MFSKLIKFHKLRAFILVYSLMIKCSSFLPKLPNQTPAYKSVEKILFNKIWLPVLLLHSKLRRTLVMQRYTYTEEPNIYLDIWKQLWYFIFQATTKIGNINISFKDFPHTVAQ